VKKTFCTCCFLLLIAGIVPLIAAQSWTPNGPLPRFEHTAVFDPSTRQMIVYGGYSSSNSMQNPLGDIWRLLPSASLAGVQNWVALHPGGTAPAPRASHFAGYDPGSNRMVVFGGATAIGCVNETWVLTNPNGNGGPSAWSQLSPLGGPPAPRVFVGGAYDPVSNTLMVYGGNNCTTVLSDYWVLSHANGQGGPPTWTELFPSGGPGPRNSQTAVYDPTSNELIFFGGGSPGTIFNDVWVLTNANGTAGTPVWNQLSPVGGPPATRVNSTATYDPVSNRMTIFGGYNGSSIPYGDTWVLANANGTGGTPAWTQIAQASTDYPAPREAHTAVYDASRNVMIVFGGAVATQPIFVINDVFFLSNANGQ